MTTWKRLQKYGTHYGSTYDSIITQILDEKEHKETAGPNDDSKMNSSVRSFGERTSEIQECLGIKLCFIFRNFPITKVRPLAYETALAAETAAA